MSKRLSGYLSTPGGKSVPVNVIDPDYVVKTNFEDMGQRSTVVPLIDHSGVGFVSNVLMERIQRNRDCPVLLTGDPGIGKSTLALELALGVNPQFGIESIAFWLEDFTRIYKENPFADPSKNLYPQIMLDEAGYALFGYNWMDRMQIEVAKLLIISRIKRQIIYMAVPKRGQLNVQARDRPFMWIHVFEPHEYEQGAAKVYMAPPEKQSEFYPTKYWEPKLVFTFKELKGEIWEKYEEKKIEFVNEAHTESGKAKVRREIPLMQELHRIGYTQDKIATIMGYRDSSKVSKLLSEAQALA